MIRLHRFPLAFLAEKLRAGEPFAFSRWGDGEWSAILGREGQNCDGQPYTPELRTALSNVLRSRPSYLLGMQGLAVQRFGAEIETWLGLEALNDLEWADAGVFHKASMKGRFEPMIEALRERGVALVGPARLSRLDGLFPIVRHAVVPERDAYSTIDAWSVAAALAAATTRESVVIAVSSGMGAKVLVHDLYGAFPGRTVIDFGSVWEPYVGHKNRNYHEEIIRRLAA